MAHQRDGQAAPAPSGPHASVADMAVDFVLSSRRKGAAGPSYLVCLALEHNASPTFAQKIAHELPNLAAQQPEL